MLTNSWARHIAQRDLETAFTAAGLIDGVAAGERSPRSNSPAFWHTQVTIDSERKRDLYIVYDVISSTAVLEADDEVFEREVAYNVKIWSARDFDNIKVRQLVEKIELALIDSGFSVVFDVEAFNVGDRYCQPIRAWKTIIGGNHA